MLRRGPDFDALLDLRTRGLRGRVCAHRRGEPATVRVRTRSGWRAANAQPITPLILAPTR
jgi:hypothetical protein